MSLSDTSALALLWTQGTIHTSKNARSYLESLDLKSGRELFKKCNSIWGHYDEVIKNRKKCILDMSRQILKDHKITQMVILGAGFDALSVEILHDIRGLQVYEADAANMHLKEQLVKKTSSRLGYRIHCMDADLKNPDGLLDALKRKGWNNQRPSLLIMEGISYYLTKKELRKLICLFKKDKQNRVLLEYLLPRRCISKNRADIPAKIFSIIKDRHHVPLVKYDEAKISCLLGSECSIVRVLDLKEMEMARTGNNMYFKSKASGWIQVCEIIV